MSGNVIINGPIAFAKSSGSAVYFSSASPTKRETSAIVKKIANDLNVAFWGEDNRFPQNIESQMAYCGVGKSALEFKAKNLFGSGIIPGKITGYTDDGSAEIFKPLDPSSNKDVYNFLNNRTMFRFLLEFSMDWAWYNNCFPEVIFSNDRKKITHFIHQESCDCRFTQMNDNGNIESVLISKLWGLTKDQYAKFDPKKAVPGAMATVKPHEVDNKYVKSVPCIDMYNALESAKSIAEKGKKSAILPVNFPSPNKTYYQVPAWDGARLAGWVEIAIKIPQIVKLFLDKGQKINYHIEVPETYFTKKYGEEKWMTMTPDEQLKSRHTLVESMDEFLTSDKSDLSTFMSFFDVDPREKTESGRIKINTIEQKSSMDGNLLSNSAAELQILAAMGIHPSLPGAGTIGNGTQRTGGSDQREAYLIYNASRWLERQVALEPLYFARDFNDWDPEIQFRIMDIKLTTLDQNSGKVKSIG